MDLAWLALLYELDTRHPLPQGELRCPQTTPVELTRALDREWPPDLVIEHYEVRCQPSAVVVRVGLGDRTKTRRVPLPAEPTFARELAWVLVGLAEELVAAAPVVAAPAEKDPDPVVRPRHAFQLDLAASFRALPLRGPSLSGARAAYSSVLRWPTHGGAGLIVGARVDGGWSMRRFDRGDVQWGSVAAALGLGIHGTHGAHGGAATRWSFTAWGGARFGMLVGRAQDSASLGGRATGTALDVALDGAVLWPLRWARGGSGWGWGPLLRVEAARGLPRGEVDEGGRRLRLDPNGVAFVVGVQLARH